MQLQALPPPCSPRPPPKRRIGLQNYSSHVVAHSPGPWREEGHHGAIHRFLHAACKKKLPLTGDGRLLRWAEGCERRPCSSLTNVSKEPICSNFELVPASRMPKDVKYNNASMLQYFTLNECLFRIVVRRYFITYSYCHTTKYIMWPQLCFFSFIIS